VTHSPLQLHTVFHLNLAYSSIEEEQRPEVVRRCYWPLLRLAREFGLPLGIEATGYTLETIAAIDPSWVDELRRLTAEGPCEFIGSGYAQIIGPLVPAEVNAANLRLGNHTYERLLGLRPSVALVNEQAYAAGLVLHYLNAGYRAIVMEWDNPARFHTEWNPEWRYLPQYACGPQGEEIPLIWNMSIVFQKFQRYAHGEMKLEEYLDYLGKHVADTPRVLPLYGNDIEIFDFRPGRYHTEASLQDESEWERIRCLFKALSSDRRFRFIPPGQVLSLMNTQGGGHRLSLESSEQPIPVKKQGKYNITRWAVTGRDDLGINTACWRVYAALKSSPAAGEAEWRELCYLWSSDFRTHITEKRWGGFLTRLADFEKRVGAEPSGGNPRDARKDLEGRPGANPKVGRIQRTGRFLVVETDSIAIQLNCQRGLAVESLCFKGISDLPLCGTLHHGYYDDIDWGADYYTGHLVVEQPGQAKVADLSPVSPQVEKRHDGIAVESSLITPFGPIRKRVFLPRDSATVEMEYMLEWDVLPVGSLRLGHVTLNPTAFDRQTLHYRTHNGGFDLETFPLADVDVDHGDAVSFLVSSSHGMGVTGGEVDIGDAQHYLRVRVSKSEASLIGLLKSCRIGSLYFCRLSFSAGEIDETRRIHEQNGKRLTCRFVLSASKTI